MAQAWTGGVPGSGRYPDSYPVASSYPDHYSGAGLHPPAAPPPAPAPPPMPAPPAAPGRRPRRRPRALLVSLAVTPILTLAVVAAVLAPLRNPLPVPVAQTLVADTVRIPGQAPAVPWPTVGQAVVEVDGVGRIGTSGATTPVPIASVAKVMTAYAILVRHPLNAGEPGPGVPVSAARAAAYAQEKARDESLVPVRAGAVFTQRQALEAVLLPSANNMARILAEWDSGSIDAFVGVMNRTAVELGMTGTRYTDPAGYDPGTVSTAVDQVILTRAAMKLPAFAAVVAQTEATMPIGGRVTNYNSLLGTSGVIGVKTGSTDGAGGCLSFAATVTVAGRGLLVVGVVLGQPGADTPAQLSSVFSATRALLTAVGSGLVLHTVVPAGAAIARVRGPLDTGTVLAAAEGLSVIGWPGQSVGLSVEVPSIPRRLAAGVDLGTVTAQVEGGPQVRTTLRTSEAMVPPTTWTRIKRRQ